MKQDVMAERVASTGEMNNACRFWAETLKGREHLKDLGIDGRHT
jgi:hypothetical protein